MASSRGVLAVIWIYVVFYVSGFGDCANDLQREEEFGMQRTGGEKQQSLHLALANNKDGANENNYGKFKDMKEKVKKEEKEHGLQQLLPNHLQREEEFGLQRTGGEKEQSQHLALAYNKDGANENMLTQTRSLSMPLQVVDSMANYEKFKKKEKVKKEEHSLQQLLPNQNDDFDRRPNEQMVTELSPFRVSVEKASVMETYRKFKHKDEDDNDDDDDTDEDDDDDDDDDDDKDKDKEKEKQKKKREKEKKMKRKEKKTKKEDKQRRRRPLIVEVHWVVLSILGYILFSIFKRTN